MVTSKVREAAAFFVEQGRALGALDQARVFADQLTRAANLADGLGEKELSRALGEQARAQLDAIEPFEQLAISARARAEELVREVEHPGAVLARRLLATWRGARAAWRGSR